LRVYADSKQKEKKTRDNGAARAQAPAPVVNVVAVGPFEEEEEGTIIASNVLQVKGEDPATPDYYLRSVDTRKPRDCNDSPISG